MSNMDLSFDDEIDLRNIIKTIWKARKAILIITLTVTVVAFTISKWVLPKQYKATAFVIITEPVFQYNQSQIDPGPEIVQQTPDVADLMNLIVSPAFLKNILNDQAVETSFEGEEISPNSLGSMLDVNRITNRQLSLRVTDSQAQRAVLLANTWAEKVTELINSIYGLNGMEKTLQTQVLIYQEEYEQTQASLEEALSKSQVSILESELNNNILDMDHVLADISNAKRVLDDLLFFEQGLSDNPGESLLSLGDALALTNLRQQALLAKSGDLSLQIDSISFTEFTVLKALEATSQMRTGLQDQLLRLQSEQERLMEEIPQLKSELENALSEIRQFNLQNDQAYQKYTSLLNRQDQITTELIVNPQIGQILQEAITPDGFEMPKVYLNTFLAGILGLILGVIWALIIDWWNRS